MPRVPADFLDVLKRTTDTAWLQGMLDSPDSAAILNALFDVAVTVDTVAEAACDTASISKASGGRPGVATLTLTREDTTNSAAIPKGYRFVTGTGVDLVVVDDTPLLVGQATVVLQLQSIRLTETANNFASNQFLPTTIGDFADAIVSNNSPVLADSGVNDLLGPTSAGVATGPFFLRFVSVTPVQSASSDWLTANGRERGQLRQPGETEEDYRARVRNIPDAVSPRAISESIQGVAQRFGVSSAIVREPYGDAATPVLKEELRLGLIETFFLNNASGGGDFFDDYTRELVGARQARAYFRIDSPQLTAKKAGDVPYFFLGDVVSDVPPSTSLVGFWDDTAWGFLDAIVVGSIAQSPGLSGLLAMWEEANRKRAGGVQFDVFLVAKRLDVYIQDIGTPGGFIAWELNAPLNTQWIYVDGLASAVLENGLVWDPAVFGQRVRFTFFDATTFDTPIHTAAWSNPLPLGYLTSLGMPDKRITKIQGIAYGDSVQGMEVTASFWVLDVIV